MRSISIPISDLIGYLSDTINEWPLGYKLESGAEAKVLAEAAATFATECVLLSVPHLHDKADPLRKIMEALGYPVNALTDEELDDLEEALDDHYLAMTSIMDASLDGLTGLFKNKEVIVERSPNLENIVIRIQDDIRLVRLREQLKTIRELLPPKTIDAGNLDDVELRIARYLAATFDAVSSEAVRLEVKRIFDEGLNRH